MPANTSVGSAASTEPTRVVDRRPADVDARRQRRRRSTCDDAAVDDDDRGAADGHASRARPRSAGGPSAGAGVAVDRAERVEVELVDAAVAPDLLVGVGSAVGERSAAATAGRSQSGPPRRRRASAVNVPVMIASRRAVSACGGSSPCASRAAPRPCSACDLGEDLRAGGVDDVLGLVEQRGDVVAVDVEARGSSGVGGVTSVPWLQLTSASRRSYFGQSSGQRHGASGARSRLHFRTVSPFG